MEWTEASFAIPNNKDIFNVWCESEDGKRYKSFGYWNGEDWERVHEASEHKSYEPEFDAYGMKVTHWLPNVDFIDPK